jgi:hypothetical protein
MPCLDHSVTQRSNHSQSVLLVQASGKCNNKQSAVVCLQQVLARHSSSLNLDSCTAAGSCDCQRRQWAESLMCCTKGTMPLTLRQLRWASISAPT